MEELRMILGIINMILSVILAIGGRYSQATFTLLIGLWSTGWLTN